MELAFKTHGLRQTCENAELASSEFGNEVARELLRTLADLRAARSLDDLVAGSRQVDGEHVTVDIFDSHHLDLIANHVKNPLTDGHVNWSKVTRLRVLGVRRRGE